MHRTPASVQVARSFLALTLAATLLVVLIVSAPRPAAADGRQIRFDDVSIDVGALAPATRDAVERSNDWRAVTIDVPTLAARLDRSVAIELFDDMTLDLAGGRFGRGVSDTTWTTRGARHSATLTIAATQVRGTAYLDGHTVSIVPAGGATHLIIEEGHSPGEMAEPLLPSVDGTDVRGVADVGTTSGSSAAPDITDRVATADESAKVIKVLTVYSTDARTMLGGDAEAVGEIEATLDVSNTVLTNSGIGMRLESVGIEPVPYTHPGSGSTDLTNALTGLTDPDDGVMDAVHARRDELAADVVMLVIGPAGNACGLAWLLQDPADAQDDEFAFGVIDTNCANGKQYGYVHEVGHLLGAGHGNGDGGGIYPYSNGFRDDATGVRTIMAYRGSCGCDRMPYFSAPRSVDGKLIGSLADDNTRTLNQTASRVAGYRPLPISPTGPYRLLETRPGPGNVTADGGFQGEGPRSAGSTLTLQIAGRPGVPADAAAVMLNVTAVNPDRAGHITVYPCDEDAPTASNLNYGPGQVVANAVLAKLDPLGRVCIYTHAATDLLVDVNASIPPDSSLGTLVPARLLETRRLGERTADGEFEGEGMRPAGSVLTLQIAGRDAVPPDAVAAMLNVTALNPDRSGHVTVFPCDQSQPTASNLNYTTGQVIPNAVLATLDPQGRVCIYTHAAMDLLVDVNGFVEPGSRIGTLTPARLLDTRFGPADTTIDGRYEGVGALGADRVGVVPVMGRANVPPGATLAFLNITAVNPDRPGHLSVFPCDEVPNASNINYLAATVVANLVVAGLDEDGDTCIYTFGRSDLLVDVTAFM